MRAAGIARASFCSAEIAIEPNEKVTKSLHGQTKHVESKKPRLVTEANCFLRIFFGAAGRNRTADLRITNALFNKMKDRMQQAGINKTMT